MDGRYRVTERIGTGAMAAIYRAEQDGDPREVALKIIRPEIVQNRTVSARFHREAKAASKLRHAGIVRVLGWGFEKEMPYIAMELIDGEDLFEVAEREGPLPQAWSVLTAMRVCDALAVAHEAGVVHRDLKPENVMVIPPSSEGGEHGVKVLDFGIAKLVGPVGFTDETVPQVLTKVGSAVGTPSHMAPEQARGDPVDGRTDIYALGVLLYEMVTGHLPFEGNNPLLVAIQQVRDPPPPPSRWLPEIHPTLERVILHTLEKSPDDRPQTAGALGSALEDVFGELVGEHVVDDPETAVTRITDLKAAQDDKRAAFDSLTNENDAPTLKRDVQGVRAVLDSMLDYIDDIDDLDDIDDIDDPSTENVTLRGKLEPSPPTAHRLTDEDDEPTMADSLPDGGDDIWDDEDGQPTQVADRRKPRRRQRQTLKGGVGPSPPIAPRRAEAAPRPTPPQSAPKAAPRPAPKAARAPGGPKGTGRQGAASGDSAGFKSSVGATTMTAGGIGELRGGQAIEKRAAPPELVNEDTDDSEAPTSVVHQSEVLPASLKAPPSRPEPSPEGSPAPRTLASGAGVHAGGPRPRPAKTLQSEVAMGPSDQKPIEIAIEGAMLPQRTLVSDDGFSASLDEVNAELEPDKARFHRTMPMAQASDDIQDRRSSRPHPVRPMPGESARQRAASITRRSSVEAGLPPPPARAPFDSEAPIETVVSDSAPLVAAAEASRREQMDSEAPIATVVSDAKPLINAAAMYASSNPPPSTSQPPVTSVLPASAPLPLQGGPGRTPMVSSQPLPPSEWPMSAAGRDYAGELDAMLKDMPRGRPIVSSLIVVILVGGAIGALIWVLFLY